MPIPKPKPTAGLKSGSLRVSIAIQARLAPIRFCAKDSSGNAGAAVAAYCASAGIACEIFVPADTSPGKLSQINSYGATVHSVPGSREDTAAAARITAADTFYASHVYNPFFFYETKTFAFEIWEQLGFRAPDVLIVPTGNGTLLLGAAIGFDELFNAGEIDWKPKIVGVQAANCAPLFEAFESGNASADRTITTPTVAEGIAISDPKRGAQILEAVRDSGGFFVTVSEAEIADCLVEMCARGFFIEPTSAATISAIPSVFKAGIGPTRSGKSGAQSAPQVVTLFSGHGLKAADKVAKIVSRHRGGRFGTEGYKF